jgi:hypothetical protein
MTTLWLDTEGGFVGTIKELADKNEITRNRVIELIKEGVFVECYYDKNGLLCMAKETLE